MCFIGVTEGKIENLKKEGNLSVSILYFIYILHFAYLKVNTKFHKAIVAEKTLTKNVHMYFIGVTEGKIENLKKEGKMRIIILIFIYTIHFVYTKFQ